MRALAFQTFKWLGVAYLLYMAWSALRERGALQVRSGEVGTGSPQDRTTRQKVEASDKLGARSALAVTVEGILINILNPKLSIFFLAFLPQFIAADEAQVLARMLELSGAFMAMTFAVFVVYGLCAASVRERVISRPAVMMWLRRSFAAGFAMLGARLAFAER